MKHTVIGGGLAGLTAAIELARGGAEVDLYEQRHELGGRAISAEEAGVWLNLGPHALYQNGLTMRTLAGWGIDLPGGAPKLAGNVYLVRHGERYGLPAGFAGLAMTGALSVREKLDFAAAYAKLQSAKPEASAGMSVGEWLDRNVSTAAAREVLEALMRLSTYCARPGSLAFDAVLRQVGLSGGGVWYLDGGWQTMIAALKRTAEAAGVRIHVGQSFPRPAEASILAVPPAEAERLLATAIPRPAPLRMAAFDLVLDGLPEGAAYFALGSDAPFYFSVHSQWAKLATNPANEGRVVVHAAKYLGPGETASRGELEQWCDLMMPGWRSRVLHARFLPDLVVVHAAPMVGGRPGVDVAGEDGPLLAGDWVGPDGMLADAAVASGLAAARRKLARQQKAA